MKSIRRHFTAAALAAFAMTAALPSLSAQGRAGGGGNRLDYLAGYLTLTEAQKTQAKTIFDAATAASETARGQLTAAREALTAAVKINAADARLDQLAAAVGVIEGQLQGINAKASAKFYALLTAEQKIKYDDLGSRSGGGAGRNGPPR